MKTYVMAALVLTGFAAQGMGSVSHTPVWTYKGIAWVALHGQYSLRKGHQHCRSLNKEFPSVSRWGVPPQWDLNQVYRAITNPKTNPIFGLLVANFGPVWSLGNGGDKGMRLHFNFRKNNQMGEDPAGFSHHIICMGKLTKKK